MDAVGKTLPDDSKLLRLTVISADEGKRKAVLSDLLTHPALSPLKPQLVVQTYAPSHWAVKDAGFTLAGDCVIYLQRPDGKVLHRQDEYRGPEKLAEAIRKADPSYDPKKDQDLNKVIPLPFGLDKIPPSYLLLGGGAALAYLLWRKK
jgi:hypothetical protein